VASALQGKGQAAAYAQAVAQAITIGGPSVAQAFGQVGGGGAGRCLVMGCS
jgi:hypothetical protein